MARLMSTPTPPSVDRAHRKGEQLAPSSRRNFLPREWSITLAKSIVGTNPHGSTIGSDTPHRNTIGEIQGGNTPHEGMRVRCT